MKEVKWIRGNVLELAIPLQKVTVTPDGKTVEDYVVPEGAQVTVKLKGRYRDYSLAAVVDGNLLHLEDNGTIMSGRYAVEILIKESDGKRRRSQWPDVLHVYEDNTAKLDEFEDFPDYASGEVLEASVFYFAKGLKGDDGSSAYEVAMKNGFDGTEEEWLKSLKGEDSPGVNDVYIDNVIQL